MNPYKYLTDDFDLLSDYRESYEMKTHAWIFIMIHPDYRKYMRVNYIVFMLIYKSA